jgi:hypothetical protein
MHEFNRTLTAVMKGEGMGIFMKRLIPWAILLLVPAWAGCTTTGPQRIYLDRYSNAYPGVTVANFSMGEVESFVRYFATEKGYEIKFADSTEDKTQGEVAGDDSSLLWMAEKQGSPTILFISSNLRLIVSFVKPAGSEGSPFSKDETKDYARLLYTILKGKFGEANVHLVSPAATP